MTLKKWSHPLVTGTVILTLTGLVSRFIGFFYRIFLSNVFGAEGMGIYQLISPVLALSFSLTVSGIQTAISKFVAGETSTRDYKSSFRTLWAGFLLAMALSVACTLYIYLGADHIACVFLMEERTAPCFVSSPSPFPWLPSIRASTATSMVSAKQAFPLFPSLQNRSAGWAVST